VALERAVSKVERIIDTGYRVIRLPAVLASGIFIMPMSRLNFWLFWLFWLLASFYVNDGLNEVAAWAGKGFTGVEAAT
jgi:hypothetical protein